MLILFPLLLSNNSLTAQQDNEYFKINKIIIVGNEKTQERVIKIALNIFEGDSILKTELPSKLEWAKNNLKNLYFFGQVSVTSAPVDVRYTELLVVVNERWSLWPLPILENAETNFNTWWQKKDFKRLNFGALITKQNFRGRAETLATLIQVGYSKRFGVAYAVPFASPKGRVGVKMYAGYHQNHEVVIGTQNNERMFYTGDNGKTREHFESKLAVSQRFNFFTTQEVTATYNHFKVVDSVVILNSNYLKDGESKTGFFSLKYELKKDKRDYKPYPLKGHYFDLTLQQNGLFTKDVSLTSVKSSGKFFSSIKKPVYFGIGYFSHFTINGDIPYLLQQSLGYHDYVRGYEYYVLDGNHYALIKGNIKLELIQQKRHILPFVKNENRNKLFYAAYLNFYADYGYVWNDYSKVENNLTNQNLMGYGIGFDFISIYESVFRVEFSRNKLKQHGFFLHFTQPI